MSGLLDHLGGGAGAVGVGGNYDVYAINGLSALLTSQVVIGNTGDSLSSADLIYGSRVLGDDHLYVFADMPMRLSNYGLSPFYMRFP